jgi:hypothetical protein
LRSSVARARSRRAIAARTSGASAGRPAASAKGSAASIWSKVCAASSASAAWAAMDRSRAARFW